MHYLTSRLDLRVVEAILGLRTTKGRWCLLHWSAAAQWVIIKVSILPLRTGPGPKETDRDHVSCNFAGVRVTNGANVRLLYAPLNWNDDFRRWSDLDKRSSSPSPERPDGGRGLSYQKKKTRRYKKPEEAFEQVAAKRSSRKAWKCEHSFQSPPASTWAVSSLTSSLAGSHRKSPTINRVVFCKSQWW